MTQLIISHKSCEASILIERKGIASIQGIGSKEQGKGHARECMKKIEIIANNYKVKEIWYPTVLSSALEHILLSMNYLHTNFGPHPMMPDTDDVIGYKKILEKKS